MGNGFKEKVVLKLQSEQNAPFKMGVFLCLFHERRVSPENKKNDPQNSFLYSRIINVSPKRLVVDNETSLSIITTPEYVNRLKSANRNDAYKIGLL